MKKTVILSIISLFMIPVSGQSLYLSQFVPGNQSNPNDLNHKIEIFNESQREYKDISGYLLVTRRYIVRFPESTYLPPLSSLKLGKLSTDREILDLEYVSMQDFMVRIPSGNDEGDFAVLYDRNLQIVDAFYYSRNKSVNFLPTSENFVTYQQQKISVKVPEEGDSRWSFIQNPSDPAMAFVRINDRWKPNSRRTNLFPATKYRFLQAKYVEGIVTVKWKTLFERDCYYHTIERSSDGGNNYQLMGSQKGPINNSTPHDYTFYDAKVEKDRVYYYRITNLDKFGNLIQSKPVKVRTEENLGGFTFDILRDEQETASTLNVRFSSKEDQKVRVKILDEEFREIAVLFYGNIEADKQNLINYTEPLNIGRYYLIVSTENRRYYEPFFVKK